MAIICVGNFYRRFDIQGILEPGVLDSREGGRGVGWMQSLTGNGARGFGPPSVRVPVSI